MDGETVQTIMPSEKEVSKLVSTSEQRYKTQLENAKLLPEKEKVSDHNGTELSRIPIELKSGDWILNVMPSRQYRCNGHEEYSGTEDGSAGCSEEYSIVNRKLENAGEEESLLLEADIGGGVVLQRQICFPKDADKVFRIDSSIIARSIGAGAGGFSRVVCLRVHPTFTLLNPTESFVSFTSVDGSKHEIRSDKEDRFYEGNHLPNGEWMLVDKRLGWRLINRFDVKEVVKCLVHWGIETVNLELWTENRPVSKESPLRISHEYDPVVTCLDPLENKMRHHAREPYRDSRSIEY